MKQWLLKRIVWLIVMVLGISFLIYALLDPVKNDAASIIAAKPVIYLYPEETTQVEVLLETDGELVATWPAYGDGWRVTAQPDGTLTDGNGNEYSYLFWEAESDATYDFSQGFCVAGEDTGEFLRETLAAMGLTPREYNEFIVYWLPLMRNNPWNLISFQGEAYTENAVLTVSPAPDSLLRVFMAWRPLTEGVEIEPQAIEPFQRNGFTVVEWGGAQVK